MKRVGLFFFLIVLLLNNTFAQCSESQININTASAEDLDKITYIGIATAVKIISARPFSSIDELTNVSGIGEVKLKAIKDENLACVEGNDEEEDVEEKEETVEEERIFEPAESSKNTIAFEENLVQEGEEPQKIQELQIIKLNSKDIKNNSSIQENKEKSLTAKYAGFGLMALCILLVILLFSKERKHGIE